MSAIDKAIICGAIDAIEDREGPPYDGVTYRGAGFTFLRDAGLFDLETSRYYNFSLRVVMDFTKPPGALPWDNKL